MLVRLFRSIGNAYMKKASTNKNKMKADMKSKKYKLFFGVTPEICVIIWQLLEDKIPEGSCPKHLLWTFLFLKQYSVENSNSKILKTDVKTFRTWTWIFVHLLADLKVVYLQLLCTCICLF